MYKLQIYFDSHFDPHSYFFDSRLNINKNKSKPNKSRPNVENTENHTLSSISCKFNKPESQSKSAQLNLLLIDNIVSFMLSSEIKNCSSNHLHSA